MEATSQPVTKPAARPRRNNKQIDRTDTLIESFRGKPGEFDMLKGLLCMGNYLDRINRKKCDDLFDRRMIAARMDEINAESIRAAFSKDPVIKLLCCCCGSTTIGRQWFNRDTGYGICQTCADAAKQKMPAAEVKSLYGIDGVNFNLSQKVAG